MVHTLGIRFLFAFVAAIGLWVWRTEVTTPGIHSVPVPNPIPVEVSGVTSGLIVVPQPNQNGLQQVTVQAEVPTDKEPNVSSSWFRATIDLSGQKSPGTQQYPVVVVALEPGVTPVSWVPQSLAVTLDTIATRTLPIQPQYQGNAPTGYSYSSPVLDNNTNQVTISGPSVTLQQIATVIVVVRLDNRKGVFHDIAPLVPQNASGGDVPTQDLQLSPKTVGYTETIQQPATTRAVPVVPQVTGQLAEGYVVAGITVTPLTTTLVGNSTVLDSAPASIGTDAVDVANATGDVTKIVSVQPPKDTSVVGDAHVKVTVLIRAIPSSAALLVAPVVTGVRPGDQVQVNISSINVTLQGSAATIKSLQPKDIGMTIDATGLNAGQHTVTPTINLPTGVTVQTITPDTVLVTIIPPTPTATPTATHTPTVTHTPVPTVTPTPGASPSPTALAVATTSTQPTTARRPADTPTARPAA